MRLSGKFADYGSEVPDEAVNRIIQEEGLQSAGSDTIRYDVRLSGPLLGLMVRF